MDETGQDYNRLLFVCIFRSASPDGFLHFTIMIHSHSLHFALLENALFTNCEGVNKNPRIYESEVGLSDACARGMG